MVTVRKSLLVLMIGGCFCTGIVKAGFGDYLWGNSKQNAQEIVVKNEKKTKEPIVEEPKEEIIDYMGGQNIVTDFNNNQPYFSQTFNGGDGTLKGWQAYLIFQQHLNNADHRMNILEQNNLNFQTQLTQEREWRENNDNQERKERIDSDNKLEKNLEKLTEEVEKNGKQTETKINDLQKDIDKHTGKAFLNVFGSIVNAAFDQIPAEKVKVGARKMLIWDEENMPSHMMAYLVFISVIVPQLFSWIMSFSPLLSWFDGYFSTFQPFFKPFQYLVVGNSLNRMFWFGHLQFTHGYECAASALQNFPGGFVNKLFMLKKDDMPVAVAFCLLALFALTVTIYTYKKYQGSLKDYAEAVEQIIKKKLEGLGVMYFKREYKVNYKHVEEFADSNQ